MTTPFSRQESYGYLTNYLARLFVRSMEQRILPLGVSPAQFAVLLVLYDEEGLSQIELSRRVLVEQPTMANTLKRMKRDGLVQPKADPHDGRRSLFFLSDKTKVIISDLLDEAQAVHECATTGMSEAEQHQLKKLLRKMISNLAGDAGMPILD